jgi:hypothetical protein
VLRRATEEGGSTRTKGLKADRPSVAGLSSTDSPELEDKEPKEGRLSAAVTKMEESSTSVVTVLFSPRKEMMGDEDSGPTR